MLGARHLGDREGDDVPDSVISALIDHSWTRAALARYLVRLLDGEIRGEPEQGEPATDTRVIVIEATAILGSAIVEGTPA